MLEEKSVFCGQSYFNWSQYEAKVQNEMLEMSPLWNIQLRSMGGRKPQKYMDTFTEMKKKIHISMKQQDDIKGYLEMKKDFSKKMEGGSRVIVSKTTEKIEDS